MQPPLKRPEILIADEHRATIDRLSLAYQIAVDDGDDDRIDVAETALMQGLKRTDVDYTDRLRLRNFLRDTARGVSRGEGSKPMHDQIRIGLGNNVTSIRLNHIARSYHPPTPLKPVDIDGLTRPPIRSDGVLDSLRLNLVLTQRLREVVSEYLAVVDRADGTDIQPFKAAIIEELLESGAGRHEARQLLHMIVTFGNWPPKVPQAPIQPTEPPAKAAAPNDAFAVLAQNPQAEITQETLAHVRHGLRRAQATARENTTMNRRQWDNWFPLSPYTEADPLLAEAVEQFKQKSGTVSASQSRIWRCLIQERLMALGAGERPAALMLKQITAPDLDTPTRITS